MESLLLYQEFELARYKAQESACFRNSLVKTPAEMCMGMAGLDAT